jgi:hypothetical protein
MARERKATRKKLVWNVSFHSRKLQIVAVDEAGSYFERLVASFPQRRSGFEFR